MRPNPSPIQGPTMTPETPKPVEVTQADRDLRNALEQHAHGDQGGNGYLTDDALPLLARHRLSTRPEAQTLSTVSGIAELVHGAMVWAAKQGGGEPKPWQNGNSIAEGEARRVADKIAALSPTVSEADEAAARVVARAKEAEELVKRMVNRFLNWKLPADFHPDNGISCQRPNYGPNVAWEPVGTNLLSYTQAETM